MRWRRILLQAPLASAAILAPLASQLNKRCYCKTRYESKERNPLAPQPSPLPVMFSLPLAYDCCAVQKAQRRAPIGISLKHSEHFRVVGSAGGSFRALAIRALIGSTTKKYMAPAMIRNDSRALMNSPYRNLLPLIVNVKAEKSGCLTSAAMNGVSKPLTKPVTTVPNAAPITMPTAMSTTFPLSKNCLNPFIVLSSGPH